MKKHAAKKMLSGSVLLNMHALATNGYVCNLCHLDPPSSNFDMEDVDTVLFAYLLKATVHTFASISYQSLCRCRTSDPNISREILLFQLVNFLKY